MKAAVYQPSPTASYPLGLVYLLGVYQAIQLFSNATKRGAQNVADTRFSYIPFCSGWG